MFIFEKLFPKKEETTKRVSVNIPSEFLPLLEDHAQLHNTTVQEILTWYLKLGLVASRLEKEANSYLRIYAKGVETRLTLNSNNLPEVLYVTPVDDAESVLKKLQTSSASIEKSPDEIQKKAEEIAAVAVQLILKQFGNLLTREQLLKLASICEGFMVVKNLKEFISLDRIKELMKSTDEDEKLRALVDVNGMVLKPYHAVIIDEELFAEGYKPERRVDVFLHEIWHILSENRWPEFLDEAATDYYAEQSSGVAVGSENRMLDDFAAVSELWRIIVKMVGEECAFTGYSEFSSIEETVGIESKKVIKCKFIDTEMHVLLRERLGTKRNGEYIWDEIMELIEQKKGKAALRKFKKSLKS